MDRCKFAAFQPSTPLNHSHLSHCFLSVALNQQTKPRSCLLRTVKSTILSPAPESSMFCTSLRKRPEWATVPSMFLSSQNPRWKGWSHSPHLTLIISKYELTIHREIPQNPRHSHPSPTVQARRVSHTFPPTCPLSIRSPRSSVSNGTHPTSLPPYGRPECRNPIPSEREDTQGQWNNSHDESASQVLHPVAS